MGYIYIMTNPSFEEYVKIGYAKDVKQRLDEQIAVRLYRLLSVFMLHTK